MVSEKPCRRVERRCRFVGILFLLEGRCLLGAALRPGRKSRRYDDTVFYGVRHFDRAFVLCEKPTYHGKRLHVGVVIAVTISTQITLLPTCRQNQTVLFVLFRFSPQNKPICANDNGFSFPSVQTQYKSAQVPERRRTCLSASL